MTTQPEPQKRDEYEVAPNGRRSAVARGEFPLVPRAMLKALVDAARAI